VPIAVQLDNGHGLRAGDEVRFLGIAVGDVREVRLQEDLAGVVVTARLRPEARELARAGSRFWVVRPELALDRVTGLDTLIGPRYLAVLPGEGEVRTRFVGLAAPPPVQEVQPGDLEVVVEADQRHGLRVGAPLLFRQVRVGTVVSIGLSSDAGSVEARLHVASRYAQLIRPETVFWPIGGVRADLGITGFSLELETLQTLLIGGVALATPPDASPQVHTGHRFRLATEPPEQWLQWQPMAVIGSELRAAAARRAAAGADACDDRLAPGMAVQGPALAAGLGPAHRRGRARSDVIARRG
jgi:paraquat-inducible protein B